MAALGVWLVQTHDEYSGRASMSKGYVQIEMAGVLMPSFSCEPGTEVSERVPKQLRDAICQYAGEQLMRCPTRSGSFRIRMNEDHREGWRTRSWSCG